MNSILPPATSAQRKGLAPLPAHLQSLEQLFDDGARDVGSVLLLTPQQVKNLDPLTPVYDFLRGRFVQLKDAAVETLQGSALTNIGFELSDKSSVYALKNKRGLANHKLLGITGSMGSGKTSYMKQLAADGAEILSADVLAREVVAPGTPGNAQIRSRFGDSYFEADGTLNRKKLGRAVFADPVAKRDLENITLPLIQRAYAEGVLAFALAPAAKPQVIAYEAPILFEARKALAEFDAVVVVTVDHDIAVQRIMQRDGLTKQEAEQRLSTQMPPKEKERLADIVVRNNGTLAELQGEASRLAREALKSL